MHSYLFRTIKTITLFSLVFWTLPSFGQDISGEWNGVITQDAGGMSDKYYFSVYIEQDGENITGFSKVELYKGDKRVLYARKKITGTFSNRLLSFKETEIIDEEIIGDNTNICLTYAKLNLIWDKSTLCLKGTWGGYTKVGTICAPGEIKVCSTIPVAH